MAAVGVEEAGGVAIRARLVRAVAAAVVAHAIGRGFPNQSLALQRRSRWARVAQAARGKRLTTTTETTAAPVMQPHLGTSLKRLAVILGRAEQQAPALVARRLQGRQRGRERQARTVASAATHLRFTGLLAAVAVGRCPLVTSQATPGLAQLLERLSPAYRVELWRQAARQRVKQMELLSLHQTQEFHRAAVRARAAIPLPTAESSAGSAGRERWAVAAVVGVVR